VRYYRIAIGNGPTYSSVMTDMTGATINNANALGVQFQVELGQWGDEGVNSFVRVLGVPMSVLSQASNFAGASVSVDAGFWPGIPLSVQQAQPPRRGNLIESSALQAYGNWRGTDISLDLILLPGLPAGATQGGSTLAATPSGASGGGGGGGIGAASASASSRLMRRRLPSAFAPRPWRSLSATPYDGGDGGGNGGGSGDGGASMSSPFGGMDFGAILTELATAFGGGGYRAPPVNLIHNAQPGQWFGAAAQQTLSTAFPGATINTWFSQALKLAYQDGGYYQNLQQYASYMKSISIKVLGRNGVQLFSRGDTITLTDWTTGNESTVDILYSDLIGQPTWINVGQIQFDVVMRADLIPPVWVNLPRVPFTTPVDPSIRNIPSFTTFSGSVQVFKVRHVGDSRSPDGQQWRTSCWANAADLLASVQAATAASAAASNAFYGTPSLGGGFGSAAPSASVTAQRFRARRVRHWG
jgi:hypothetical protein